jgi:hypothetical protein
MAHLISGETFRAEFQTPAQSVSIRFAGPSSHTANLTNTGGAWKAAVQTEGWPAGLYWFDVLCQDAEGNKWTLLRDRLDLKPSLSSLPEDSRTDAERMVEMIEAMMAGNASAGVRSYKINNRELERYGIEELLKLLAFWRNRLVKERRKSRGESPFGPDTRFRF